MYLVYKPDGQAEQRWLFQPGKLRSAEAEAIEKRTGMAYGTEFKEAVMKGNVKARRALLWTFLRREHHMLRFEDVDFADDELVLEMDVEEWAATRAEVERSATLAPEERAAALEMIDRASVDAPEAPGKAPTGSSENATPSLSPS